MGLGNKLDIEKYKSFLETDEVKNTLDVFFASVKKNSQLMDKLKSDKTFFSSVWSEIATDLMKYGYLDLYDYEEDKWNVTHELPILSAFYETLIEEGVQQDAFTKYYPSTDEDYMFTDYVFAMKYGEKTIVLEQISGQGETHKTLRLMTEEDSVDKYLDLDTLTGGDPDGI